MELASLLAQAQQVSIFKQQYEQSQFLNHWISTTKER
jgi:hypothetical protein